MQVQAPPSVESGPPVVVYVVRRSWHIDIGFEATDLHMPLASLHAALPKSRYLLFGFGDKHYLLTHGRALDRLSGAVLPGDGVVLLTGLAATPEEAFEPKNVIRLTLRAAQADRLEDFIWQTLATDKGVAKVLAPGPYSGSLYYASVQRYSGLHTCNNWAAEALRSAGLPIHTFGVEFASQLWRQVRRINRKAACYRPDKPPSSGSPEAPPPSFSAGEADCCC